MWIMRSLDADILSQMGRYTTKHRTHNHVAVIFQGRKRIAIGQNRACQRGERKTVHAEADAIRSLGDISKLRGATLVVIRIAPTGLLNSAPCKKCCCLLQKCMRVYGMKGYVHS
jgi:hypothetical protein